MYAPMLLPLSGVVTGILCARMGADWMAALAFVVAGVALYLILLQKSRDIVKGFGIARWHHLWIYLIFTGIGIFSMDLNRPYADDKVANEAVAFMGHGNPVSDYDHANASYEKIEQAMQKYAADAYGNGNVFVGTVDYPAMLIDYVIGEMTAKGVAKSTPVNLHPLMSIAGDHANNDMAGDEEDSWKSMFMASGKFDSVDAQIVGLGQIPAIQDLYVAHTAAVME